LEKLKKQAQLLERKGKYHDTLNLYQKIIKQEPKNATNYNAVAVILYKMGRYKDAVLGFEDAIRLDVNYSEAYSNLGAVYAKLKEYPKAIKLYKRAIKIKPNYSGSYTNLGNALNKIDEHEEAIHFHNIAINIDPKSANNYANCGSAYKNLGRFDRAENMYKKAIDLDPNHINAHFDLATVLLQQGKNAQGFKEYEWRFRKEQMATHLKRYSSIFNKELYKGQKLDGEKVLVHLEQGFGDAIMIARYLFDLKKTGAYIIIYAREGLERLLLSMPCVDEVILRSDELPEFDYQISIMSLPLIFDKNLDNIINNYPYFQSKNDFDLNSKKMKIGIAWGASNSSESYESRAFDLRHFKILSKNENISTYSLQIGEDNDDIMKYNMQDIITDLSSEIDDFMSTLEIINSLDLVITSDTSVAHLAGAMGKKTWVILPKIPDWRWGIDENISKWYPSVRLFRQHSPKDFNSVFRQIYTQIQKEYNIKVMND